MTFGAAPALAAYLALAVAVTLRDGHYDPLALACLFLAAGLTLAGLLGAFRVSRAGLARGLWVALVLGSLDALLRPVGSYLQTGPPTGLQLAWLALVLLFPRLPRWRFPLALLLAGALGLWLLRASPSPAIDVWALQQEGAIVLASGGSPYVKGSFTINETANASNGTIDAYLYPPPTLVTGTASYALTGDVRYALLVFQLVFAWALARLGPAPIGELAGLLWLTHPRGLYVLEQSWTEPLPLALGALGALAWSRGRRRLAALAWGVFLASKQYLILLLPLVPLLQGLSIGWCALACAACILPFLAVHPWEYLHATVLYHLRTPFRDDALTLPAALRIPALSRLAWPAAAAVWLAASRRRYPLPRWLYLGALLLTVFFMLAQQAYCNYYYLIGGWLLLGVAADAAQPVAGAATRLRIGPLARLLLFTATVKLAVALYEFRALPSPWMAEPAQLVFRWLSYWANEQRLGLMVPHASPGYPPVGVWCVYSILAPFVNTNSPPQAFLVHAAYMALFDLATVALVYRFKPAWIVVLALSPLAAFSWLSPVLFFVALGAWCYSRQRPALGALAWSLGSSLFWGVGLLLVVHELRARKRWQWILILAAVTAFMHAQWWKYGDPQTFFGFQSGCFLASLEISAAG